MKITSYRNLAIVFSLSWILLVIIVMSFIHSYLTGDKTGQYIYDGIGGFLVISTVTIIIRGFVKIEANELGVLLFFGKPLFQISSGLFYVLPFFELQKAITTQKDLTYPSTGDVPANIRITHGATNEPSSDPLDTRLITSVSLVVNYKMVNYIDFIRTIGNYNQLRLQIKDRLINAVAIECAKITLAINLTRREEINFILKKEIKEYTRGWGIEINNVQLQDIDLGNEIDIAQKNRSVSEINVVTNKNNAQNILFEGEAQAKVQEAFYFAKTKGLNELSSRLNIEDTLLVYKIDTLERVFRKSNADLNMYGGDLQQFFNAIMSSYNASAVNQIPEKEDAKKLS